MARYTESVCRLCRREGVKLFLKGDRCYSGKCTIAKRPTLLMLLELRLDNVCYRLGFGNSRPQARQIVTHGHITVNGKRVDIASYEVKVGDVIGVHEGSRSMEVFKVARENTAHTTPKWLELNADALEGKVIQKPAREDIDLTLSEHLVVEYYSKR